MRAKTGLAQFYESVNRYRDANLVGAEAAQSIKTLLGEVGLYRDVSVDDRDEDEYQRQQNIARLVADIESWSQQEPYWSHHQSDDEEDYHQKAANTTGTLIFCL